MQNCSVDQSALLSGFGTDLRHQYGISGRESQTSLFCFSVLGTPDETPSTRFSYITSDTLKLIFLQVQELFS